MVAIEGGAARCGGPRFNRVGTAASLLQRRARRAPAHRTRARVPFPPGCADKARSLRAGGRGPTPLRDRRRAQAPVCAPLAAGRQSAWGRNPPSPRAGRGVRAATRLPSCPPRHSVEPGHYLIPPGLCQATRRGQPPWRRGDDELPLASVMPNAVGDGASPPPPPRPGQLSRPEQSIRPVPPHPAPRPPVPPLPVGRVREGGRSQQPRAGKGPLPVHAHWSSLAREAIRFCSTRRWRTTGPGSRSGRSSQEGGAARGRGPAWPRQTFVRQRGVGLVHDPARCGGNRLPEVHHLGAEDEAGLLQQLHWGRESRVRPHTQRPAASLRHRTRGHRGGDSSGSSAP